MQQLQGNKVIMCHGMKLYERLTSGRQTKTSQALTLAMCPLAACLFEAVGPVRATTIYIPLAPRASGFLFFFLVLRMPPLFLLGIDKTRKATLIRTYFSL